MLIVMWVSTIASPLFLDGRGWRDSVTFLIAGLGFVVTLALGYSVRRRPVQELDALAVTDRERMGVLNAQAASAYFVATAVELLWDAQSGQVPVIIGLAAIVGWTIMGEALMIYVRNRALYRGAGAPGR